MDAPILRVARPSDDLNGLLRFYCDGLGLMVLCRFEGHAGFDGIMLGQEGAPYHFEFTKKRGHAGARESTADDLLIFYYPEIEDWHAAVRRMLNTGFAPVRSLNPFWDREGVTFEDPDGYRVVLQNSSWDR
jgi:catechol 2,3-dioxygenase-like lactoylglutathione lyase family enzyme